MGIGASPRQVDADSIFDRDWDNLRAAHSWAITTANLAAADSLIAVMGPHAWCRMSHEHGDWATQTLTLDCVDRHANATTYGWVAYWAYVGDDHGRSVEASRQGIYDAAPAPEHPDTSWCWAVLVNDDLASGRNAQSEEDVRHLLAAAAGSPDPFVQWWVLAMVVDVTFGTDLAAVADSVARLVSLTDRIGAPSLRARTVCYQGRQRMWAEDPPDAEGALACYRKGLDIARRSGDITSGNLNLVGIVYTETRLRTPTAADACSEAITCLYDTRHWSGFWLALGAVAAWWVAAGTLEAVAVIRGHIDAHHPPWSDVDQHQRELLAVRQHPDADRLMAHGAAMGRDQLVSFVLDQLAVAPT